MRGAGGIGSNSLFALILVRRPTPSLIAICVVCRGEVRWDEAR